MATGVSRSHGSADWVFMYYIFGIIVVQVSLPGPAPCLILQHGSGYESRCPELKAEVGRYSLIPYMASCADKPMSS